MDVTVLVLTIFLMLALLALGVSYTRLQQMKMRLEQLSQRVHNRERLETRAQELRAERSALQALGEVSFDALLLIDSDHQVMAMNAAARELFDQPDDWQEGADSVMSITRNHELDDLISTALENSDEPITYQVTMYARPYRVRTLCIESPAGPYVSLALEDISELQRLGRARRDMVANISHELRTPITSIRLLVDTLLRGDIKDPDKATPLAEKMALEVGTLEQMAQELLDLAMIESGRAEFKLVAVPVQEITEDAVRRLAQFAERSHITVTTTSPADLMVLADAEQVARVLTNLLHNAIKFTPAGGSITIATEPGQDSCTIAVTDTGVGIPIQERERIFERFYRGDRSRQSTGTGLGLAIAKHIIEAHGGRIWAGEPPLRADAVSGAHICFTLRNA